MSAAGLGAQLIVGPWSHDSFADPIGDRLFGMQANRDQAAPGEGRSCAERQLQWLHGQLVHEHGTEPTPEPAARIFVMGRNEWREESRWPPQRAQVQRWFLLSDGSLTPAGPEAEPRNSEFVYDPSDPVPTCGGHGMLSPEHTTGPVDQAPVEQRKDVLVFTSAPLTDELEVAGRVRVLLHAQSSAPSTDWVARLCDVQSDGRSFNICDGIVRVLGNANQVALYEIDLWSTCNVFLRGHRLRVHVTSSSFPRWDRNLNTGDQSAAHIRTARQRIHHHQPCPSFIELPVIDRA
jgi:putative CocE/NonD family hydrolase